MEDEIENAGRPFWKRADVWSLVIALVAVVGAWAAGVDPSGLFDAAVRLVP
ncbi:hypothetical protein [Oricola thermophila]|uniref:Uncharacterized protein n=1 Tax=Oricola thermophila TaxID=2742145 RepID=A0A6N1VH18_9HYPH|nr:hypothetical protein [Oricola thermophila]QKV20226.1 hypothetical protein HTY61_18105 [Oricola thermophila]